MVNYNQLNNKKQKGSGLFLFMLLTSMLMISFMLVYTVYSKYQSEMDTSIWKKELSYTLNEQIIDLPIYEHEGSHQHYSYYWYHAQLSSGDYLINPDGGESLCNIHLSPHDPNLIVHYSVAEMQNYLKTDAHFEVKKIPTSWVSDELKKEIASNPHCNHIDVSGTYVKYHDSYALELVKILPN